MSLEATLKTLLGPLVGGRCYPDTAPDGAAFPLIIYQQVGGVSVEFLDQTLADKDNARMQVYVWAKTRTEASSIARQAREAIIGSALQAKTLVAPVSLYEQQQKLYGSRTDFGVWYSP